MATAFSMNCRQWNTECTLGGVNVRTIIYIALLIAGCHRSPEKLSEVNVTPAMVGKALESARAEHKSLMVEFGADWCTDCRKLSQSLEGSRQQDYLRGHFIVMKIDVGQFNRNLDTARSLGIDVTNPGIPVALFFIHEADRPVTKFGTPEILAFLAELASNEAVQ